MKYVYMFSEGNKDMRNLLGGKGANLAEMTSIGLPVPRGFTVTTEACTAYYDAGILCTAQSANSLTFTAKTVPTSDLTVYVAITEVG